jgi:RecB family endonuclease NucS
MNIINTLKIYGSETYKYFFVKKELHSFFKGLGIFSFLCTDGAHYEGIEASQTPDGQRLFIYANDFFNAHPILQKDDEIPFEYNEKTNEIVLNITQWENHPEWKNVIQTKNSFISSYSLLYFVQANLQTILPGLKPYNKKALNYRFEYKGERICIGLLLIDRDKSFVVVEAEKSEKEVLDKIGIIKDTIANGAKVRGIIIKEFPERSCSTTKDRLRNENLETKFYQLNFSISDEDSIEIDPNQKGQFGIMPDSEAYLSNYLATHIYLFDESLQVIKREYEFDDSRHKIDILCRDANLDYTIIENKLHDSDYKVVGQVLYYFDQIEKTRAQKEGKKARAIILMAKKCKDSPNVKTVKSALKCSRFDCDIRIKFYETSITFMN